GIAVTHRVRRDAFAGRCKLDRDKGVRKHLYTNPTLLKLVACDAAHDACSPVLRGFGLHAKQIADLDPVAAYWRDDRAEAAFTHVLDDPAFRAVTRLEVERN